MIVQTVSYIKRIPSLLVIISVLAKLVKRAGQQNIEVVPLLNFGQSGYWRNNHWFRPHNDLFDNDEYWKFSFEIIDEIIGIMKPPHYFHIGMDEDHWRSNKQYIEAILRLRKGLVEQNLRPIIWNCSALNAPQYEIFKEKSLLAEKKIPRDVVHIPYLNITLEIFRRIVDYGFTVWDSPFSGAEAASIKTMCRNLLRCGGEGVLLTKWIPFIKANRKELLEHVHEMGPLCSV